MNFIIIFIVLESRSSIYKRIFGAATDMTSLIFFHELNRRNSILLKMTHMQHEVDLLPFELDLNLSVTCINLTLTLRGR